MTAPTGRHVALSALQTTAQNHLVLGLQPCVKVRDPVRNVLGRLRRDLAFEPVAAVHVRGGAGL
jgi:hypothetical protein